MGYFSNGSEADYYQAEYCNKCVNMRDNMRDGRGHGCPILDLHSLWNYDATGKDADETKKEGLEMFIPRNNDGSNGECTMFLRKEP